MAEVKTVPAEEGVNVNVILRCRCVFIAQLIEL
jgi:hypothetical protein